MKPRGWIVVKDNARIAEVRRLFGLGVTDREAADIAGVRFDDVAKIRSGLLIAGAKFHVKRRRTRREIAHANNLLARVAHMSAEAA